MSTPGLRVDGLKQLRRELKKIDASFDAELKEINWTLVNELITPAAKTKAGAAISRGGKPAVKPGGAVVNSIKALRQAKAAIVSLGGAKAPHAAGYEFGSMQLRKTAAGGHTTQFPIWRGNGEDAGYFLHPTIREKRDEILAFYSLMIGELLKEAFP
jgi:hypothetical protein